jgi:hypothetical protein
LVIYYNSEYRDKDVSIFNTINYALGKNTRRGDNMFNIDYTETVKNTMDRIEISNKLFEMRKESLDRQEAEIKEQMANDGFDAMCRDLGI